MSVNPDFATVEEADATYYGDGGDGSTPNRWGEPQTVPTDWRAGWGLSYQQNLDDSEVRRYFVTRQNPQNGDLEALTEQGQITTFTAETPGDEIPHFESESTARSAYQSWAESNGTPSEGGESEGERWGEWQRIEQAQQWQIWGREHQTEDRAQFMIASINQAGDEIYLHPGGEVQGQPHLYDSIKTVRDALNAFATKMETGEVPEGQRPTGSSPSREQVRRATTSATGGGPGGSLTGPVGATVDAVGGPVNAAILATAAAGGVYYLEREGHIDMTEQIP